MEGTLSLGRAVQLSARTLRGPPGLCVGWGGQEAGQEGALQSDSVSNCHGARLGLKGFPVWGRWRGEALPHRKEAAGVLGRVKPALALRSGTQPAPRKGAW